MLCRSTHRAARNITACLDAHIFAQYSQKKACEAPALEIWRVQSKFRARRALYSLVVLRAERVSERGGQYEASLRALTDAFPRLGREKQRNVTSRALREARSHVSLPPLQSKRGVWGHLYGVAQARFKKCNAPTNSTATDRSSRNIPDHTRLIRYCT